MFMYIFYILFLDVNKALFCLYFFLVKMMQCAFEKLQETEIIKIIKGRS